MANQSELDYIPPVKYEYLDHTADVQLHSWGDDLEESFEQCAMAMFGYMTTDYNSVEMTDEQEIEAEGHDMLSLLFHFLDEWLFIFSAEPFFIPRKVVITEFDKENFKIKSKGSIGRVYGKTKCTHKLPAWKRGRVLQKGECFLAPEKYGEEFDISKHPQGTEVKAITYSNMQIHDEIPTNDIYVIIDI